VGREHLWTKALGRCSFRYPAGIEPAHDLSPIDSPTDAQNRARHDGDRRAGCLRRSQIAATRDCAYVDPDFSPPASLNTSAYAGIAADVANNTKNVGVTFSCIHDTSAGTCGSFTQPGAGSAVPVCYLAPDSVPNGNTVTVTATSVSDTTKSVSAIITILSGPGQACPP